MREIKFRAWDKDSKEMIPLFNIDFEHNIMNKGSLWKSLYSVELLQYIWLKDKNGKEIYEGDLVKCIAEEKYSKESWVYPIEYYASEQQFIPKWACNLWWGWWTSIEVVGNIYENENPELGTGDRITN